MNKFLTVLLAALLTALLSPLYANQIVGKASHADPPKINEESSAEEVATFLDASAQNTAEKTKKVGEIIPKKVKEAELLAKVFENDRAKKACLVMKTCQKWALEEFKKDSAFRVVDISVVHSNFVTKNDKQMVKRIDLRFMFNKNKSSGFKDFQLQNVPVNDKRCVECKELLQDKKA